MSPAAIAALQRSADELTAILESASIGIAFTRDRIVLRSNRRAAEIFGYRAAEELVGKPASIMHADEDSYARFATEAGAVLNAGESFHADCQLRKCDGSLVWCSVYAKAVEPDRPDRGTVWMVEDITDAKQAVLTLQQSDSLLDNTLSHMDQGISIVDGELNMLAVNRRFAELLDFPPALCAPVPSSRISFSTTHSAVITAQEMWKSRCAAGSPWRASSSRTSLSAIAPMAA